MMVNCAIGFQVDSRYKYLLISEAECIIKGLIKRDNFCFGLCRLLGFIDPILVLYWPTVHDAGPTSYM